MKSSELLRMLKNAGWYSAGQKGSHIKLKHPNRQDCIIFPNHGVWRRKLESRLEFKHVMLRAYNNLLELSRSVKSSPSSKSL